MSFKNFIFNKIENANNKEMYEKVQQYIVFLKEGCIKEEESLFFNEFLF